MANSPVVIIGAGVAGLACARVLSAAGVEALLFDKGRGPGGRCSTRRSLAGRFDHGAPYFEARDPRFMDQVETWCGAGVVETWQALFRGRNGEVIDRPLWTGAPAMNAFIRYEAEALDATFGVELGAPIARDGGFDLYSRKGELISDACFVVVATPAPQAAALLPAGSDLQVAAASAIMQPCWTLMAAFGDGFPWPAFDVWEPGEGPFDKIIWQASGPGRQPGSRFVAHAHADWAKAHLEDEAEEVSKELAAALLAAIGADQNPSFRTAHRWRYARAVSSRGPSFGLDVDARLASCGDWHKGPDVEDAWISGHELGQALLAEL